MRSNGLGAKILVCLAALTGAVVLPVVCFSLRNLGPAARVVYYDYLPIEELTLAASSAVLGAGLCVYAVRRLGLQPSAASDRLPIVRLIGLGLLLGWLAFTQLRAFPASASVSARDSWARSNLPQYLPLTRVVAAIPEVQRDVGRVVAIAPTASDQHRAAREMNGDDMKLTLDVIGERGHGIFHADCTLDAYRVYDWRSGRWMIDGRQVPIERVPERVP